MTGSSTKGGCLEKKLMYRVFYEARKASTSRWIGSFGLKELISNDRLYINIDRY